MTIPRFLLALPLSIILTFVILTAYALYPLAVVTLRQMSGGVETAGVAGVVGGVHSFAFLIVEPVVFVIVFGLLSRKPTTK